MARRVVITSMGIVSALGNCPEAVLESIARDHHGFERSQQVPDVAICPIHQFNLSDEIGRFKNKRYLNRGAAFSVAAAIKAIKGADLDHHQLAGAGLFVGAGPHLDMETYPDVKGNAQAWTTVPALWMLKFLPNTATSAIAQLAGIHGENATYGNACAASLTAIGEGFRKVRDGYLEVAVAGGGDSRLSHGGLMAYAKAGALSDNIVDPSRAMRPFDNHRSGFVPGEGGGFVVMESLQHAQDRGATILGEICGYAASMDGQAMTAPDPQAKWAEVAVRAAINDAGMAPHQIQAISAHGTGTPLNDAMEVRLIDALFGKKSPWIMALKSWIGHLASACGAVELVVALACIRQGFLPRIRNLSAPCHDHLRFARHHMHMAMDTMLIENFGFGGQNAAVVIRKWND